MPEPITFVGITQNRIANMKRMMPRIIDYVDKVVIIDGFSTDGTKEWLENYSPKIKVVQREWDDNFGKQHGEYLKHIDKGWVLLCDDDEVPSRKLLECLPRVIEESEDGDRYAVAEFRCHGIEVDDEGVIIRDDGPSNYRKQLFFQYRPCMYYTVELHQKLHGHKNSRKSHRNETYYHIKTNIHGYKSACRNWWISGVWDDTICAGYRPPEWHEFKKIVLNAYPEIKIFNDFNKILIGGNINKKVKDYIIKVKDLPDEGGRRKFSELRTYYKYYFDILHPEERDKSEKKKMNIFMKISGQISDGLVSPTRGEGRWGFNLARVLADKGHKIILAEDGGSYFWGNEKKHPNIEIIPWNTIGTLKDIKFDVYITASFAHAPEPIKAKRTLIAVWGLGDLGIEPLISEVQEDEYILAPTRHTYIACKEALSKKNAKWIDRYRLLCQPYGAKFGESKFHRKKILFTAKDAFHVNNRHTHEDGIKNLFAAVDACKETGSELVITSAHWKHPDHAQPIKELGVLEKLSEVRNVRILPIIPWDKLMYELSMGSIIIPLTFAGSTPDALMAGLVPLLRKNSMLTWHPDVDTDSLVKEMGDSLEQSQEEIKNTLIRLLTDEDFYNYFQERLQKVMIDHLDGNVLKQFYDIIEYDENRKDLVRQ